MHFLFAAAMLAHVIVVKPETPTTVHVGDTVVIPLFDAKKEPTFYGGAMRRIGTRSLSAADIKALRKIYDINSPHGEAFIAQHPGRESANLLLTWPQLRQQCVSCRTAHYFITVIAR